MHPLLIRSVYFKSFLLRLLWLLPEKFRAKSPVRAALKQLAETRSTVRFLNIGSNDGLSGDPLREFIITRKWRGILVEPVDFVFNRLKKAYAGCPGVKCENMAIARQSGTVPFWYFCKEDGLPPGYDQVGSLNREHVAMHAARSPNLEPYVTCRDVACCTIEELLKKHGLNKIELILIDTEGFDFEVVKQIDLKNQAPDLLIYEELNLSEVDKIACRKLLQSSGYSVLSDGVDGIATTDSVIAKAAAEAGAVLN
jgi:FkbM family methyltransferase